MHSLSNASRPLIGYYFILLNFWYAKRNLITVDSGSMIWLTAFILTTHIHRQSCSLLVGHKVSRTNLNVFREFRNLFAVVKFSAGENLAEWPLNI